MKGFTRSEVGQHGEISRSCIDHCYTNVPDKVTVPELVAVGSSDHLGIVIKKFTRAPKIKPKIIQKRCYKNFIIENFLNDILTSHINEVVTACDDLEAAAEKFENIFGEILDKHAPMKKIQVRKNYLPYLSVETKLLMEDRKAVKEESVATGDKVLVAEAKKLGKLIKRSISEDEKAYYGKDFGEHFDVKTAWRTAKDILGTNKNLAPTAIKVNNENAEPEYVTNPKKLAGMFNNFFREKVEKLREKTDQEPNSPPKERLKTWLEKEGIHPPPFQLNEIDKKTFRGIMKKIKGGRVHGVDNIDSYSLKISSPLIEDCLLHLVNMSIRKSKFSSKWKPQLIFPFHKKKEKDKLENYRPVSHLVQVGIIVEYAVYFQIVEHFTRHSLFHPNHHGSLADHSTATAIIQLYDLCLHAGEHQKLSAVCLLDQSAAYDLLCHQTLKDKLEIYNFSESSISWLMSYLGGRSQLVQIEASTSSQLECEGHAVPQGSVLGGLLHVINSNDFPACHESGESVVYVDDDSDVVHEKDPEALRDLIQSEGCNSASWLRDNRLCVAADKSKLLIIGSNQLKAAKEITEKEIEVEGQVIKESKGEKLLGVVLGNDLTWKSHLYGDQENEGLIPQLSKRVGIMRQLSKYMDREKLKFFASGIFYSKLSYCLPVFGNVFGLDQYKEESTRYFSYTKEDNNRLQIIQNNLNRLLLGADYRTSTTQLLQDTGTLSIQQMIAHQTAVMAYKIVKSKKPSYLAHRLQVRQPGIELRGNPRMITQPGYKLGISREGFLYRSATLLNMMDEKLREEPRLEIFKSESKKWVKKNIKVKPASNATFRDYVPRVRNSANQAPNTITNYFHPVLNTSTNQDQVIRPATRQTFMEQFFPSLGPNNV